MVCVLACLLGSAFSTSSGYSVFTWRRRCWHLGWENYWPIHEQLVVFLTYYTRSYDCETTSHCSGPGYRVRRCLELLYDRVGIVTINWNANTIDKQITSTTKQKPYKRASVSAQMVGAALIMVSPTEISVPKKKKKKSIQQNTQLKVETAWVKQISQHVKRQYLINKKNINHERKSMIYNFKIKI